MKEMSLKAFSTEDLTMTFVCLKCKNHHCKIIFRDMENYTWYCPTCLIKELNKPE